MISRTGRPRALARPSFRRSLAALLFTFALPSLAGGEGYERGISKDGRVEVESRIQNRPGPGGKDIQVMDYVATMQSDAHLRDVMAVLKDVSLHGTLIEEKTTRVERRLSENQWLIYYFFDMPWPLADSDMAAVMTYVELPNNAAGAPGAEIHIKSAPNKLPLRGVNRMAHYEVRYTARTLANKRLELVQTSNVAPSFEVPEFMIRSYFPEGPAGVLRRLEKLAKARRGLAR